MIPSRYAGMSRRIATDGGFIQRELFIQRECLKFMVSVFLVPDALVMCNMDPECLDCSLSAIKLESGFLGF